MRPIRVNDRVSAPLLGSSSASAPGAAGGAGSTTTSKRSAGSCSKWAAWKDARSAAGTGDCGCSRYSISRTARQWASAMAGSLALIPRTSAYRVAMRRRQSASHARSVAERSPMVHSGEVMPPSSRARAIERAEDDGKADDDEDDRPELAPIEVGQIEPQRRGREEPAADDQEQDTEDERGPPPGVGGTWLPGGLWRRRRGGRGSLRRLLRRWLGCLRRRLGWLQRRLDGDLAGGVVAGHGRT